MSTRRQAPTRSCRVVRRPEPASAAQRALATNIISTSAYFAPLWLPSLMSYPRGGQPLEREPAVWIRDQRTLECGRRLVRLPVCEQQLAQKLIEGLGGPGRPVFKLHRGSGRNGRAHPCNSGAMLA